jgi:hypothetical protein
MAYQPGKRMAHWVGLNHQNRIPSRWVAFDTESRTERGTWGSVQTWRLGVAARWRTDLKVNPGVGVERFHTPLDMWEWVTDFCKPKTRTIVWAHNLSHDVRISDAMTILPQLGWRLDWCNMSSSVSTMTWRSDRGTLTFTDLWSWLPMSLEKVGQLVGLHKKQMPNQDSKQDVWFPYCERDVMIVVEAVQQIVKFVRDHDLGNWQPTGAGMAFATWRHKFMEHKVLVHDNYDALSAERQAMHTGRAEAWKHGKLRGQQWVEVDLRQAYVQIARDTELPTKLKWHFGKISRNQYNELSRRFNVLARVQVHTSVPNLPVYVEGRTLWPVGTFTTWLWDCETSVALATAASVEILEGYVYTKAPILGKWAQWVLDVQEWPDEQASPAIKRWIKHSGRTLIGRIALRTSQWAVWGTNPENETGVSYQVDADEGKVYRLMHAGDRTFREEARVEGHDSLPQITGYIMAECRVQLWRAMLFAGTEHVAHVDTDSLIVSADGVRNLKKYYGAEFDKIWQIKATYNSMDVYGPRNYRGDSVRKTAGIPVKAVETAENRFTGESWSSLARDLAEGRTNSVTVTDRTWKMTKEDPRRLSAAGGGTATWPVTVDQNSKLSSAESSIGTSGS